MSALARALNSSDLTHEDASHDVALRDVDVLRAIGLASQTESLGVLIIEAREGAAGGGPHSVARIKDLEQALGPILKSHSRRWRLRIYPESTAAQIVRELILDFCFVCQGRGIIPVKYDGGHDDGSIRGAECHYCLGSGSGRRDYDARAAQSGWSSYHGRLAEWWEVMLELCAQAELEARDAIWRRMRKDRDLRQV